MKKPKEPPDIRLCFRQMFSQVSAELVVAAAFGEVRLGGELVGLVQQVLGQEIPQQQVQRRRLPDLVVPSGGGSGGGGGGVSSGAAAVLEVAS